MDGERLSQVKAESSVSEGFRNFLPGGVAFLDECVSADVDRAMIVGFLVDFKKGRVVATNGHFLTILPFSVPSELAERESVVLPPELCRFVRETKHRTELRLFFEEKGLRIAGRGPARFFGYLDVEFPKYEEVIPKWGSERTPVKVMLNPSYLSKLLLAAVGSKKVRHPAGVLIEFDPDTAKTQPVEVKVFGQTVGFVMPMRF